PGSATSSLSRLSLPDALPISPPVLQYLNGHEVVLGNLESVISRRFPVPHVLPDYFTYNSDPALLTSFRRPDGRSTFTALGTANKDRKSTRLNSSHVAISYAVF